MRRSRTMQVNVMDRISLKLHSASVHCLATTIYCLNAVLLMIEAFIRGLSNMTFDLAVLYWPKHVKPHPYKGAAVYRARLTNKELFFSRMRTQTTLLPENNSKVESMWLRNTLRIALQ